MKNMNNNQCNIKFWLIWIILNKFYKGKDDMII